MTTTTLDLALVTEYLQSIARREVNEQLGGSNGKPINITLDIVAQLPSYKPVAR